MVFKYAKKAAGDFKQNAKKAVGGIKDNAKKASNGFKQSSGGVKGRLDPRSDDDFSQINDKTHSISNYERKIDKDISEIKSKYASKKGRARQQLSYMAEKEFSLDDWRVEDTTVRTDKGIRGYVSNLFGDDSVEVNIDLNSDTLPEYVSKLGDEIERRRDELKICDMALEGLKPDTLTGDILEPREGFSHDVLDYEDTVDTDSVESYIGSIMGSVRAQEVMSQRKKQLEAEKDRLEQELVDVVDEYTHDMYEQVSSYAEDLGGTERSNEGELDILRELSNSRANLLDSAAASPVIRDSGVLEESREALDTQVAVVNSYIDEIESYSDGIEHLYEEASDVVDSEKLDIVERRLNVIDQGIGDLSDVVNEEGDYDTLEDALKDTVKVGVRDQNPRTGYRATAGV